MQDFPITPSDYMSATDVSNFSAAYQALLSGDATQSAQLYEQAIELEPERIANYWYLGLALFLQGQEEEAQITWLTPMMTGEPEQVEQWTAELIQVLQIEAERQAGLTNYSVAWALRQHIRELSPTSLNNLLHLVLISIRLENLTSESFSDLRVVCQLQAGTEGIDSTLLLQVLQGILKTLAPDPVLIQFTEACLPYIQTPREMLAIVLPVAIEHAYSLRHPELGAQLLELYRRLDANNLEVLGHLALFYQNARDYAIGIEVAKTRLQLSDNYPEKIFSSHLLLRGLLTTGGRWQEALNALQDHEQLVLDLFANSTGLEIVNSDRLFNSCYYLPYFRDDLSRHRNFQNQIGKLCQENIHLNYSEPVERYQQSRRAKAAATQSSSPPKRLKIGYLSHCMGAHSVGWLARWLIQHHDRDRVHLHGYFYNQRQGDFLQDWYMGQFDQSYIMGVDCNRNSYELAERIYQDGIDILVDLDSVTLDLTAEVLSLKPAPVQVTWLGWDAPGLPAVDYFIADPYVLPDWAQEHYSEKIWRLPQTYIAVDGFEVGVPTLRRDQLDVPADAIVYLSAQRGYKRHRDTAKLQMQIIKAVPNSYFFIKGFAAEDSIQKFFFDLAEEVGVSPDRLRFLPDAPSEAIHRANLAIADIVLDTYPYNGATTTLETLWMGIPIVTRVGEQFAARNSYTMMTNAGLTEGIAWSDQEYVDWGIRLGTDPALRQQITWKLKQSRHTAPLWNAQQFTRDMESAYEQMWQLYCDFI
jgi:predicted O-linked N-acetylglucosamine transferase (SPINDLY family)